MSERISGDSRGLFAIAPTPFLPDGQLDLDSARTLCDFFIEKGASGLTVLGMMGEAPKLSAAESIEFVSAVIRYLDGRLPVVVGVSSPGMAPMVSLTEAVMDLGAAGVMVAPVTSLRTDDAIHGYFGQVAASLGSTPICLQDYPQTLGVHFSASLLLRIFKDFPSIVMLKHEDNPGLAKLSRFRQLCDAQIDRRISILTGNGGIYLPQELGRGADGAMTGFAFPEMLARVIEMSRAGQTDEAETVFDAYLPLVRHELQPGIGLAIRKHVLARRGAIAHPTLRAPGPALTDLDIAEIDALWARLDRRLEQLG